MIKKNFTIKKKNHDHMLCCSWDMVCDGCNCYFSFLAIFCSFTPLKAQKIKISKKWKKKKMPRDFIILHKCIPPPLTTQKIKISKNEKKKKTKKKKNKKNWRYHFTHVYQKLIRFTHVFQKLWLDDVQFLRSGARQMDGQTDGWKSHIQRWVPHLKKRIV